MSRQKTNIMLIGMPGAGKSTIGVLLAKHTSKNFIDTDVLIQVNHGKGLQQIVDEDGFMALRKIEEDVLLSMKCVNFVIATGGSAVYSDKAMTRLKMDAVTVFLDAPLEDLERRVNNFDSRGITKSPGQSFADLFQERLILYNKYADITVPCSQKNQDEIVALIEERMKGAC
ncbi:shikimate kinase [bacterium]|nr:shikimate kinase [bacterium]